MFQCSTATTSVVLCSHSRRCCINHCYLHSQKKYIKTKTTVSQVGQQTHVLTRPDTVCYLMKCRKPPPFCKPLSDTRVLWSFSKIVGAFSSSSSSLKSSSSTSTTPFFWPLFVADAPEAQHHDTSVLYYVHLRQATRHTSSLLRTPSLIYAKTKLNAKTFWFF